VHFASYPFYKENSFYVGLHNEVLNILGDISTKNRLVLYITWVNFLYNVSTFWTNFKGENYMFVLWYALSVDFQKPLYIVIQLFHLKNTNT
jgi:hypothetical protein